MEVAEANETRFVCNECSAVVSKEDSTRLVLEMESCDVPCPHCGQLNHIAGFSEVSAFRCQFAEKGGW